MVIGICIVIYRSNMIVVGIRVLFDHLPLIVSLLIVQVLLLPSELKHLFTEHIPPCCCARTHNLLQVRAHDVFS